MRSLQLPQLHRLLARMGVVADDAGSADSLSMPHERVLARAWGLGAADGRIPLAAWQLQQAGHDPGGAACAWVTPCHLRVGSDHLLLLPPHQLQLDAADSQALLEAMRPYFAQDGIALEYQAPLLWIARGEPLRELAAASLDRVAGRSIEGWLPQGEAGRPLRRLQQEMQMLLYTLPLNDERQRGGLLPVNSFWLHGAGALPAAGHPAAGPLPQVTHYLRDAALQGDWQAWLDGWHQLDAAECGRLVQELESGRQVCVTLCGERNARTWSSSAGSFWRRLGTVFNPPTAASLLEPL